MGGTTFKGLYSLVEGAAPGHVTTFALPQRFRSDPFSELFRMSHPLRRPAAYLSTYRQLWSASKDRAPAIFAR